MIKRLALLFIPTIAATACGANGTGESTGTESTALSSSRAEWDDTSCGAHTCPPIIAPPDQWTWIPVPNAICGNGSSTGMEVNWHPSAKRLLIFFEGGGACWDEATCYEQPTALYFSTGYTAANFQAEMADPADFGISTPGGIFDRTTSGNPFEDYSYVYLPYCTGDTWAGNATLPMGTNTGHFAGYSNVTAFLERIVPAFRHVERVIAAGSSAGGYGALINWSHVQNAFGRIPVDLIDDSGPFMPADVTALGDGAIPYAIYTWNVASILPPGCTGCAADPTQLWSFYANLYPTHRGSLLSYSEDYAIPYFYGITTPQFTQGLDELIAQQFAPHPNLHAFVYDGVGHGLLSAPTLASEGVTVQQWVTEQVTHNPSWSTIEP